MPRVSKGTADAKIEDLKAQLREHGIQFEEKPKELDLDVLSKLLGEGVSHVDISVTRTGFVAGVGVKASFGRTNLGMMKGVQLAAFIQDPVRWVYDRYGGGNYELLFFETGNPVAGKIYQGTFRIEGPPKQPEYVQQDQANAQAQGVAHASQLARTFMAQGMSRDQALIQAHQLVAKNPLLAATTPAGAISEESEDMNAMVMIAMMQAQQQAAAEARMAEAREEEKRWQRRQEELQLQQRSHKDDPQLLLLREQMEEQKRLNQELLRKMEQRESESKFDRLSSVLESMQKELVDLKTRKPEGPDPITSALTTMSSLFSNISAKDQTVAAQLEGQKNEMIRMILGMSDGQAKIFNELAAAQMRQAEHSLKMNQLRMEEPIHAAKAQAEYFGIMGGLLKTMHDMNMQSLQAQQGSPFAELMTNLGNSLPSIAEGLLSKETTRSGGYDEIAPDVADGTAVKRVLSQVEIAQRELSGKTISQPKQVEVTREKELEASRSNEPELRQEAQAEPQVRERAVSELQGSSEEAEPRRGGPDQLREENESGSARGGADEEGQRVAGDVLEALELDSALELLHDSEAVEVLVEIVKRPEHHKTREALARKLARKLASIEAAVEVDFTQLVSLLQEKIGWGQRAAELFVKVFSEELSSLAQ